MSVTTACLALSQRSTLYYCLYLQNHVGGSLKFILLGEMVEPAKAFWVKVFILLSFAIGGDQVLCSWHYPSWNSAAFSKCCLEASGDVALNYTVMLSHKTEHGTFQSAKVKNKCDGDFFFCLSPNNKNRWGLHKTWKYFQSCLSCLQCTLKC